jgi:hypothetical protein
LGSTGRSRSRGAALVAYCRCEGPLSRPALVTSTFITSAFVAAAFVAATIVAPAGEFSLALIGVLFPAAKPLAGGAALVLARSANRRALGHRRGRFNRRIGAGFAEFLVAVATAAPVPLVLYGLTGFACGRGGRRCTFLGR